MASNALVDRQGLTEYALRADDAVASAATAPESITYLLLQHESLATNAASNQALVATQRVLDEVRVSMIAPPPNLSDAEDAARRALIAREVAQGGGAHGFSRHSADTQLWQQFRRAITGQNPDGGGRFPVDSSRFLSYVDQLAAVDEAIRITTAADGIGRFGADIIVTFNKFDELGDPVALGEGILKGATGYREYTAIVVRIDDNGQWFTSFPVSNSYTPPPNSGRPTIRVGLL